MLRLPTSLRLWQTLVRRSNLNGDLTPQDQTGAIVDAAFTWGSTGLDVFYAAGTSLATFANGSPQSGGIGWSIEEYGQFYAANSATIITSSGIPEIQLTFNMLAGGSIGNGALLYYEYGTGRLQTSNPGGTQFGASAAGNAITDTNNLPTFVVPSGQTISASSTPVGGAAYFSGYDSTSQVAINQYADPPQSPSPRGGTFTGLYTGSEGDDISISSSSPSVDIVVSGQNQNAIQVSSGSNEISSLSSSSNYIGSGSGNDVIAVWVGGGSVVSDTIMNFHAGDVLYINDAHMLNGSVVGWSSSSTATWVDTNDGAGNLVADLVLSFLGNGTDAVIKFPGFSLSHPLICCSQRTC